MIKHHAKFHDMILLFHFQIVTKLSAKKRFQILGS